MRIIGARKWSLSRPGALIVTPAVANSDSIVTRSVSEECSELQPPPRSRFGFRCRSYDQGPLGCPLRCGISVQLGHEK